MQHSVGILERERHFRRITFSLGWIRNSPMCSHRLARPQRARFPRRVVTDGKHKIERWRAGIGELAPRLRAITRGVVAETLKEFQRFRMHAPLGLASGAVGAELPGPHVAQIASAMMERAELPVHRNSTLNGRSMTYASQQAEVD